MRCNRSLSALPLAALVLAACQSTEPNEMSLTRIPGASVVLPPGNGIAQFEQVEVCKRGSAGDFTASIDQNGSVTQITFSLAADECGIVVTAGLAGASVTVTETSAPSGFHFDHAVLTQLTGVACANPVITTTTSASPTQTAFASGSQGDGVCDGGLIEYFNAPDVTLINGRMTGGGNQVTLGSVKITRGFTIHCDIVLSNNLQINWPGHKWHLAKPLTSATCLDDPLIDPAPPPAPFDTFIGEGLGSLDGVGGSLVRFTFIDAGEPGGDNDKASIQIYAGSTPASALVLDVPLSFLTKGNLQAHFDQPHKKP